MRSLAALIMGLIGALHDIFSGVGRTAIDTQPSSGCQVGVAGVQLLAILACRVKSRSVTKPTFSPVDKWGLVNGRRSHVPVDNFWICRLFSVT